METLSNQLKSKQTTINEFQAKYNIGIAKEQGGRQEQAPATQASGVLV
jgi:hypothetical protein